MKTRLAAVDCSGGMSGSSAKSMSQLLIVKISGCWLGDIQSSVDAVVGTYCSLG